MGVRSFKKGQKRTATERGINKGRAEPFLSTRRTGLADHYKDRPPAAIPEQFYIKFKWHMYGSQMGNLRVHWVDENDKDHAVSNWSNYILDVDWFSNGSYINTIKSGQYQSSSTRAYQTATTETITFNGNNDGFVHFGGVIGSGYRSDIAIDAVEFYDSSDGSLFAAIPENGDNWLTNSNTSLTNFVSSPSDMQQIISSTTGGRWNLDSNSTPSSSTGPSDDSGGDGIYYMYTEASGKDGKYCSLRSIELLEEYLIEV